MKSIAVSLLISGCMFLSCTCSPHYSDEDKKTIYDRDSQIAQDNQWIHVQDSTIVALSRRGAVADSLLRTRGVNPDTVRGLK
jgi:hypothetical protein